MPAPFGLTATGFSTKTSEEILAEVNAFQQTNIHANWDVSSGSPMGQVNGIMSDELAALWEALQATYDSRDPDNATDMSLSQLALITGTLRNAAQKAQTICSCTLAVGTYLAGTLIASKAGDPDARFKNKVTVVSPGGLVTGIAFEAETAGPLEALAGTITVIAQPVSGWTTVTNTTAASGGIGVESDPAIRIRREQEIAGTGSARLDSIIAAVSEVTGVIAVSGIENVTDALDANGLPPHSFEIIIWDGAAPAASNNAIAQAIWDEKPAGIAANGALSGTAVDSAGNNQTVKFSRVTQRPVFLGIDVTDGVGYVGDAAVKTAVAAFANSNYRPNDDVILARISGVVIVLAGVIDVTQIRAGFSASPTGTVNLVIGVREIATIATGNITVVS